MSARPGPIAQSAHLLALSALAIAQPLLDILRQNPTFFTARGASGGRIAIFALVLVLLPAVALIGVRWLVELVSSRAGWVAQLVLIAALGGLAFVPPIMRALSLGTVLTSLLYVVVGVAVAAIYHRSEVVRRFVTVLGAAPVLIVGLFLFTGPVGAIVRGGDVGSGATNVKRGTPVVLAIFDEFSLSAIQRPDGELDADRFPNIAELADGSTWFPNATTNSTGTHLSVPVINTGVLRKGNGTPPPDASSYPDNLFTFLHPSMDVHAQEFTTHLCPGSVCRGSAAQLGGARFLASDAAIVFLHLVLPSSITDQEYFPQVNEDWSGFLGDAAAVQSTVRLSPGPIRPLLRFVLPRFATPPAESESAKLLRFIREMKDLPAETFHYAHVKLPHVPLEYLPSLRRYDQKAIPGLELLPAEEECDDCEGGARTARRWSGDQLLADQGLQRYLLQTKAVDELIGQMMRTLRQRGLWDDAAVVVTSDHGVTFQTGALKRRISQRTLADVMRVPLFVKAPGQEDGKIDDRNAQLIDVVPTIADALDVEPTWDVDGHSLLARDARVAKKRMLTATGSVPYELDDDNIGPTPDRIVDVFGEFRSDDDLYAFGPHADLIGSKPGADVDDAGISATIQNRRAFTRVNLDAPVLPARVVATFDRRPKDRWIAATVNGRIAGLGVVYQDRRGRWLASAVLAERLLEGGRNEIELFAVDRSGDLVQIAT